MPAGGIVLVVAAADDGEASLVTERLTADGVPVAWLDTAAFPGGVVVRAALGRAGWEGEFVMPAGTVDLAGVVAVFYRQPQPFTLPQGMSEPEERFARAEGRFGLGGLLSSLPVRWVPDLPGQVADSEYKPLQLATAARCGLSVAPTVLTNSAARARSFADAQQHGVVYKALMHKLVADDGEAKLIYTSPVTGDALDDRVAVTMHQFQANLAESKHYDARVLLTRRGQVAVGIHTTDPAVRQDFRVAYDTLTYQIIDVPAEVAVGCRRYLEALGLHLGVFDFCVTPTGWYFLECGPGAQWAWLHEATAAAMPDLVVDALIGEPA